MLNIIRADGNAEQQALSLLKSRSGEVDRKVTAVVTEIIETVRRDGDKALAMYAEKFDGKAPDKLEIPKEEIEADIAVVPVPVAPPTTEERLTAIEDALCEMDAANAASIAALEDALCEIDAGGADNE